METATATRNAIEKAKGPKGRKDADNQEMVTKPQIVEERIDEMVRLYKAKADSGVELSEAVKAAAEASGYNTKAVRALVVARAGESFQEKLRDLNQQMELFTELGE